jgi:hypothetical protein
MPHKLNDDQHHNFVKAKYRVTNWPEYDAALVRRGDLTVWLTEDVSIGIPLYSIGRPFYRVGDLTPYCHIRCSGAVHPNIYQSEPVGHAGSGRPSAARTD